MSRDLITEINEATGFLNGDKWESADEVREYFRVFRAYYSPLHVEARRTVWDEFGSRVDPDDEMPSQAQLDSWAEIAVRYLFQSQEETA